MRKYEREEDIDEVLAKDALNENFHACIFFTFDQLKREYRSSSLSFTEILRKHINYFNREVPESLERVLAKRIDLHFGGGYIPRKYDGETIVKILKPILEPYFTDVFFSMVSGFYLVRSFGKALLSGISDRGKAELNDSKIFEDIPAEFKAKVFDEYRNGFNDLVITLNDEEIKIREGLFGKDLLKNHWARKAYQPDIFRILKPSYSTLPTIDKVLIAMIMMLYLNKKPDDAEYEFSTQRLSNEDRRLIIKIMAKEYLELYDNYCIDFLDML